MVEEFDTATSKRPSPVMLVIGLVALVVSAVVLAGPDRWTGLSPIHFGWAVLIAATALGVALVIAPLRAKKQ